MEVHGNFPETTGLSSNGLLGSCSKSRPELILTWSTPLLSGTPVGAQFKVVTKSHEPFLGSPEHED